MYNNIYFDLETQNKIPKGGSTKDARISVMVSWHDIDDYPLGTEENELTDHIPSFEISDKIIGYNSKAFDMNVLGNYINVKRYHKKHFDIYHYLRTKHHVQPKLSDISVPTLELDKYNLKMTPAKAYELGLISELLTYCKRDVQITKELWEYGREFRHLFYIDHKGIKRKTRVNFK